MEKPLKLQGSWEMESAKYRYVEESLDKELRVKIFDFPLHYNGPNTLMKCYRFHYKHIFFG